MLPTLGNFESCLLERQRIREIVKWLFHSKMNDFVLMNESKLFILTSKMNDFVWKRLCLNARREKVMGTPFGWPLTRYSVSSAAGRRTLPCSVRWWHICVFMPCCFLVRITAGWYAGAIPWKMRSVGYLRCFTAARATVFPSRRCMVVSMSCSLMSTLMAYKSTSRS